MRLEVSSAKRRLFGLSLNVLITYGMVMTSAVYRTDYELTTDTARTQESYGGPFREHFAEKKCVSKRIIFAVMLPQSSIHWLSLNFNNMWSKWQSTSIRSHGI